jgi:hypothetical protein
MRDVIWTIIIVWVIYKLIEIFKNTNQKKSYVYQNNTAQEHSPQTNTTFTKRDVKSAIKKSLDKDGEYVDFEELK